MIRAVADGAAGETAAMPQWFLVDERRFVAAFGQAPVPVRHALADEECLWADAAKALARAVPPAWVTWYGAALPSLMPPGARPKVEGHSDEVFDRLGDVCASVRIYHLQHRDPYRALIHHCLDEVEVLVGAREGGIRERDATLFVSSPGAVVPAHFDRHHNVLLQITGSKDVCVGTFSDAAIGQKEIESQAGTGINQLHVLPDQVQVFHLDPGDGVYLPPYAFHWVEGREGISSALSCSFSTASSARADLVNRCNRRLRRMGVRPHPAGSSTARDAGKAAGMRAWRELRRLTGRSSPTAGC